MSSTFHLLANGFAQILTPYMLFLCLAGSLAGTLVGVLPGLGPATAIAILLPITYGLDPLSALIVLAGIFYGGMYGGTITSVLLNVPGESASVVTTFDGYPMARAGRGGVALGIAAVGSFIAGTIGVILLSLIATPLASTALKFGPPEFFALMLFAFVAATSLGGEGSLVKALISLFLGLLLATVGMDVISGQPRLTMGTTVLLDGVGFLPAIVGLYGVSEIIQNIVYPSELINTGKDQKFSFFSVFPKIKDFKESLGAIFRGTGIGFLLGCVPGVGAIVTAIISYGVEKKVARNPEKFGKGAIQGVAGPESANNASSSASFVPLLTLGIPGSATTAVLLGAFTLVGIQPGPGLFTKNPDVVWGLIASMYVGNAMLLLINTACIPFFVWLLKISQKSLPVIVTTLCFIGIYSVNKAMIDVWLMLALGILGFLFKEFNIPGTPLVMALVLGKSAEYSLRQSLVMSSGQVSIFWERPICLVLIIVSLVVLIAPSIISKMKGTPTNTMDLG